MNSTNMSQSTHVPTLDVLLTDPTTVGDLPLETVEALLGQCAIVQGRLQAAQAQAMRERQEKRSAPPVGGNGQGKNQPQGPRMDRFALKAHEVAERLGKPVAYVRALCREGRMRASRTRKEWFITPQAVQEYLDQHQHGPARSTPTPPRARAEAAPRLQAVPRIRRRGST